MQAMVLEEDQAFQAQLATVLMEKGFHVICVESAGAAENFIRMNVIDVLILGERIGGRLSHPVALLAECRNPAVSAILLTERKGPELDEVFDLLPSVYAVLGRAITPGVVAQFVMSATAGQTSDFVRARLDSHWNPPAPQIEDPDQDIPADDFASDWDSVPLPVAEVDPPVPPIPVQPPQNPLALLAERLRASPARRSDLWTIPEKPVPDARKPALPLLEDLAPSLSGSGAGNRRLHLQ